MINNNDKMDIQYGWLPNTIYPYESIWSLVQKFSSWNHCTVDIFWRQFKTHQKLRPHLEKSIFDESSFDWTGFAKKLQISDKRIMQAGYKYYLREGEEMFLASQTLRYCPSCLEIGFHSSIHQLLFIEKCPYHDIYLVDKCQKCNSKITLNLNDKLITRPYICENCNNRILSNIYFYEKYRAFDFIKSFYMCAAWLNKRIQTQEEHSELISNWLSISNSIARTRKKLSLIPFIFSSIICEPPPFPVKKSCDIYKFSLKGNKLKFNDDFNDEMNDYFITEKYIYDKFIKKHSKCMNNMFTYFGYQCYWNVLKENISTCILSHAFIIWRMYWQEPNSINQLSVDLDLRRCNYKTNNRYFN